MIKLLVLLILSLISLPVVFRLFAKEGMRRQFILIASGCALAFIGVLLQTLYPFYLVLLFLAGLSFVAAYVYMKVTERQRLNAAEEQVAAELPKRAKPAEAPKKPVVESAPAEKPTVQPVSAEKPIEKPAVQPMSAEKPVEKPVAVQEEKHENSIPEIQSVNRKAQLNSMQSIEPIRKEQSREQSSIR